MRVDDGVRVDQRAVAVKSKSQLAGERSGAHAADTDGHARTFAGNAGAAIGQRQAVSLVRLLPEFFKEDHFLKTLGGLLFVAFANGQRGDGIKLGGDGFGRLAVLGNSQRANQRLAGAKIQEHFPLRAFGGRPGDPQRVRVVRHHRDAGIFLIPAEVKLVLGEDRSGQADHKQQWQADEPD